MPASNGAVLVVDDDVDILETIQMVLEGSGHEVLTAQSGLAALELLRAGERVRVILLDMMMPGMDGWQFREAQRRDPAIAGIPVVIMTGDSHVTDKAAKVGAAAYLRKPTDVAALLSTVARFF
jgi:CheY-like chemotaxis protein